MLRVKAHFYPVKFNFYPFFSKVTTIPNLMLAYHLSIYLSIIYLFCFKVFSLLSLDNFSMPVYGKFGLPGDSGGKEPTCNVGNPRFNPWVWKIPGEGNGYPLYYSCLENSVDRRAWWATVHGVERIRLDSVTNTITFHLMPNLQCVCRK